LAYYFIFFNLYTIDISLIEKSLADAPFDTNFNLKDFLLFASEDVVGFNSATAHVDDAVN